MVEAAHRPCATLHGGTLAVHGGHAHRRVTQGEQSGHVLEPDPRGALHRGVHLVHGPHVHVHHTLLLPRLRRIACGQHAGLVHRSARALHPAGRAGRGVLQLREAAHGRRDVEKGAASGLPVLRPRVGALMFMLAPAAMRGGGQAVLSVAIYSTVFIAYVALRVLRSWKDVKVGSSASPLEVQAS